MTHGQSSLLVVFLIQNMIQMGVSLNRGTPKSSILMGFSNINHPFWGCSHLWNTPNDVQLSDGQVRSAVADLYLLKDLELCFPLFAPLLLLQWLPASATGVGADLTQRCTASQGLDLGPQLNNPKPLPGSESLIPEGMSCAK